MAKGHTIETYGRAPHNRNIWPYNSQAAAPPSRVADSFVCAGIGTLITTAAAAHTCLALCMALCTSIYTHRLVWSEKINFGTLKNNYDPKLPNGGYSKTHKKLYKY